jgi:hypothetical protein
LGASLVVHLDLGKSLLEWEKVVARAAARTLVALRRSG